MDPLLTREQRLRIASGKGLSGPESEELEQRVGDLRLYRRRIVQEMLLEDTATFGTRHVFGNVKKERMLPHDPLPFLPLEKMYVEPEAVPEKRGLRGETIGRAGPILSLLQDMLNDPERRVIAVTADFGSGKSLTARRFCELRAKEWLAAKDRSAEVFLPVCVRCADDFGDDFDFERIVRRARKRQAEDLGLSLKAHDDALVLPNPNQRTVFIFDGLDEVAFAPGEFDKLFSMLDEQATENHKFIIFSRPGALPADLEKRGVRTLRLLGLSRAAGVTRDVGAGVLGSGGNQIEEWLTRWNELSGRPANNPIKFRDLEKRRLEEIAQTPILLLMIAQTWDDFDDADVFAGKAGMYERFFLQIARGKHAADCEANPVVFEASDAVLQWLRKRGDLDNSATAPDAMLWLMSRVAWEARKQALSIPPQPLQVHDVDELLAKEFRETGSEVGMIPQDALRTIRVGLLLAMQADLEHRREHLLFGHPSFRDFLVARFWADRLLRITRAREKHRAKIEAPLLAARLLGETDEPFPFLLDMVNDTSEWWSADSPFAWSDRARRELVEWCQDHFENEDQDFRGVETSRIGDDRRAPFREALLAVASLARGSRGLEDSRGTALRSMLGWFWTAGKPAQVIADRIKLSKANLVGVDLRRARLFGANFDGAALRDARLEGIRAEQASFRHADLDGANLDRAILEKANLGGACARGASFVGISARGARFDRCDLSFARLDYADLEEAGLEEANLQGAVFGAAWFGGANLSGADVRGADLRDANIEGAILRRVRYDEATRWPEGFDVAAAGAEFVG